MSSPSMPMLTLILILLFANVFIGPSHQNPVQQQTQPTRYNKTCITENVDNGTLIISSNMVVQSEPESQSATAQFNERRRDMFFEDYNIKQIEVIDTSVITNRSSSEQRPSPTVTHHPELSVLPEPSILSPSNSSSISTSSLEAVAAAAATASEDSIQDVSHYFPNAIQPQRPNVLLPKLEASGRPSCVQTPDDTFCEVVDNYPNKTSIKSEIDLSPQQFNDIFGSKEIDGRKSYADSETDEESVCRKVPRVIYPQMAKNQANQWVYVVNEVEYTQAVVAEICEKPGKPCTHLENMPMGMYSRCKQKYSYKRLLALHPTEKRTYPDAFKFPSCCSCYIKYLDDYLGRSNFRKVDVAETSPARDARTMVSRVENDATNATNFVVDSNMTVNQSNIEILSQKDQNEMENLHEQTNSTNI